MFNDDFYPTPDWLALKMVSLIDKAIIRNILEPSAGSGNIVKAIREGFRYREANIDCIEIEPVLQDALRGQKCNIVGFDFMNFSSPIMYDCIIMNPPFSNGVNHVLRAYNMIYSGQIVALLNAESLKNPYSKERQLLLSIIESSTENTIEFISNAFSEAERKSDVEVVLIYINKKGDYVKDFFDLSDIKPSTNEYVQEEHATGNQLALKQSKISELVHYYDLAVNSSREACIKQAKACYYKSLMITNTTKYSYVNDFNLKEELNKELHILREAAWDGVWTVSDFSKLMTNAVRQEFERKRKEISKLEFTEHNIRYFLSQLLNNHQEIYNKTLLEVFDIFTKYYPGNCNHYEGWKSNFGSKVGEVDYKNDKPVFMKRRVVLPNLIKLDWGGRKLEFDYNASYKLNDIDMVLDRLNGSEPNLSNGIVNMIQHAQFVSNYKIESKHFTIKLYKKGTIHLYFKSPKTLEKLNISVGRLRNWLPDNSEPIDDSLLKLANDSIE